MVLQNMSPIRCFLHNKWPPKVWRKKKKAEEKKKKKSQQAGIGDPVGGLDAPINVSKATKAFLHVLGNVQSLHTVYMSL